MKPNDLIEAYIASKRLENRMTARSEESAGRAWFTAKRDKEKARAVAFLSAQGTVAERQARAVLAAVLPLIRSADEKRTSWRCACDLNHGPDEDRCPWGDPKLHTTGNLAPWMRARSADAPQETPDSLEAARDDS